MALPELTQDARPTTKDFWQGFPEAPFSDTFKWIDADGYEHMLTIRGWEGGAMLKAVEKAKEFIAAQGGRPVGKFAPAAPEQPRQPQADPEEPRYENIDDSGNNQPAVNSFTAERMIVDMHDGKFFFKVIGGKFTKFGINVWDEVLKAAGIKFDPANPGNIPNINGWRADYVEEFVDGKTRRKVTRLLPPK